MLWSPTPTAARALTRAGKLPAGTVQLRPQRAIATEEAPELLALRDFGQCEAVVIGVLEQREKLAPGVMIARQIIDVNTLDPGLQQFKAGLHRPVHEVRVVGIPAGADVVMPGSLQDRRRHE